MWERLDHWLGDQIRPPRRLGRRVLVLCRTRSTVSMVRRWAAHRGGVHGIDVATPATLAAQVGRARSLRRPEAPPSIDEARLPEGSAAAAWIGERPGLVAVARRWARWSRLAALVGHPGQAPPWLAELADASWGIDEEELALGRLLVAARERGASLGEVSWDRVVALGFDAAPDFAEPWESALLRSLGVRSAPRGASPSAPLPSIQVPDVGAEARVAVRWAAEDPDGTLILVSGEATAQRLRDALRRSGLGCDWRDLLPLRGHDLASAVARSAAWFQSTDPWIQVTDLAAVLRHVSFGRKLHPAAEARLADRLAAHGLSASDAWLDRRGVVALLDHARLLEAPLSGWLARMRELGIPSAEEPEARRRAARATAVEVRLQLLAAAVAGESVDRALGGEGSVTFDEDDFEAIVAELLGEALPTQVPDGATLGALRAFLVSCRVQVQGDPIARAIVAALGRRASWPASPAHVAHALGGSVDPGVLASGVQVLPYADYDGRPARRVLLLDVHDKGLARPPSPDPLLTEAEIEALGAVPGSRWVPRLLELARHAVAQAEEALAIVSRRDPDGREVVEPIRLELVPRSPLPSSGASGPVPSYGIALPGLPETRALSGLRRGTGPARPPLAEAPSEWAHLAVQATAEWYREGRGPRPEGPPPLDAPPEASLAERLAAEGTSWPSYVDPWLGGAAGTPEAVLPEGPHSATGLLTAASHCLYRAFGRHVLGLQPFEEVTADLDPKEVGQAVHEAIQRASPAAPWRVEESEQEQAAAVLVRALEAQTQGAFERVSQTLGDLSPAREASARGRLRRWNGHWPAFAASRVLPGRAPKPYDRIKAHPAFQRAMNSAQRISPALVGTPRHVLFKWLERVARCRVARFRELGADEQRRTGTPHDLPASVLPDLPAILDHPHVNELRQVVVNLDWRATAPSLPITAMAAEVPFGFPDADPVPWVTPQGEELARLDLGPVTLRLGPVDLAVHGRIDRLAAVEAADGRSLLEITDYKTGRARLGWQFRRALAEMSDPQLLVYAMVLQQVAERADLPPGLRGAAVATVAWDHVRSTFKRPERREVPDAPDTVHCVDTESLQVGREALGALLARGQGGEWPLRPHEETCPKLKSWGHDFCPFADACRLRGLPARGSDG